MRYIFLCSLMFSLLSLYTNATEYSWIEIGEHSKQIARTITKSSSCPQINLDGKLQKMNLRTSLDDNMLKESIFVCEYDVSNANKVSINDQPLKTLPKKVNRFVVIGDTGCEYTTFDNSYRSQKCDPENWPFQKIANKVAELNPDFVIHTGDMIYQMDKNNNKGKSWFFYNEDFFKPARSLLSKTPFILVRGNHEKCALGGEGWFAFFDPRNYSSCQDYTKPYEIKINDLKFIVFDSAGSSSGKDYPTDQLEMYSQEFKNLHKAIHSKHWLLIHQPVVPINKLSDEEVFKLKLHSLVIKDAFKMEYSDKITNAISGHYHLNAFLKDSKHNFTQTIIGNSGTILHKAKQNKYALKDGDTNIIANIRFGYTLFERLENNLWRATSYDTDGNVLLITNYKTN